MCVCARARVRVYVVCMYTCECVIEVGVMNIQIRVRVQYLTTLEYTLQRDDSSRFSFRFPLLNGQCEQYRLLTSIISTLTCNITERTVYKVGDKTNKQT